MNLVRGSHTREAYVNWGSWVVNCSSCPGARAFHSEFPTHFVCRECRAVTDIIWPTTDMIAGIERLLMMRPDPANRNWLPKETLHDLMFENAAHGIFDNLQPAAPGTAVFAVDDDGIRTDNLLALGAQPRRELT